MRILFVTDPGFSLDPLTAGIAKAGISYEGKSVHSREDFILSTKDFQPMVVFADYNMKSLESDFVLTFLRERFPAVSLVFLIENPSPQTIIDLYRKGAADVLLSENFDSVAEVLQRAKRLFEQRSRAENTRIVETAFNCMQLGVTVTNLDGEIIYSNPAEAKMHGYELEDLIGKDVRIFAPRLLWKAMHVDQLGDFNIWKRESVNVRQDGTVFPVEIMSQLVTDSNRGGSRESGTA